jgi:hypothetical protein
MEAPPAAGISPPQLLLPQGDATIIRVVKYLLFTQMALAGKIPPPWDSLLSHRIKSVRRRPE